MNRNEAFKAMIDGYKITHESLPENSYCFFYKGSFYIIQDNHKQTYIYLSEYEDGYEIYQEPKKTEKVTWYKVIYHLKGSSSAWESGELFKNKQDFFRSHSKIEDNYQWIKLKEVCTHEYEVIE